MSKPRKEVKITKEDLMALIGTEDLKPFVESVFCSKCKLTEIISYEDKVFLNDLGDTVLRGECRRCGRSVSRYLETGDIYGSASRISGGYSLEDIRKEYKNAYRAWNKEEEISLSGYFNSRKTIKEIATLLGRKPGGIQSRLKKLGLIKE